MVPPPRNGSSPALYSVPKASFPSLQETGCIENKYDLFHEIDTIHLGHSSSLSAASCENVIGSYHVLHFPAYFYVWDILLNMSLCSSVHLSMYFLNFSLYFYTLSHPYLIIVFKYSYFFTDLYLSFFCLI